MTGLLGIIFSGAAYGVVLFLIASGLSVTLGLMRVVNLAHGGFALIGGALASWATTGQGWPYLGALAFAVVCVCLLAFILERTLYRRIFAFSELGQVLATIGVVFIMIASVNLAVGASILPIRLPASLQGSVDLGFGAFPTQRLFILGVGAALALALYLLIERTSFGVKLRAAVDNRRAAAILGVDTGALYAITFVSSAGLAALGGVLGAELLPIEAFYPLRHMALFLIVVAVGGAGSMSGVFFGAIGLGVADTASRYYMPDYGAIPFYALVAALLLVRPNGVVGRA